MTHEITFCTATVTNCDFIGRTVSGVCAVVSKDGVELFRSKPHVKRIGGKMEALEWIKQQAA